MNEVHVLAIDENTFYMQCEMILNEGSEDGRGEVTMRGSDDKMITRE